MPAIFYEQDVNAKLGGRRRLSQYLDEVIRQRKPVSGKVSLRYIFCSDDFLSGINRQFLNHDTLTDIITFDLSEADNLTGEIYISTERVLENAQQFGASYTDELHRVIFHGVLHLCGLRDKKKPEITAMRKAEQECLAGYFTTQ